MNLTRLQPFIESSRLSKNLKIKTAADSLNDQLVSAQQAEEISQPTLHAQEHNKAINTPAKDEIDKALGSMMPDLLKPDKDVSQFGKAASVSLFQKYTGLAKEKQASSLFHKYALRNVGRKITT